METTDKSKIIVIVGPTGSGKTALSLLLAKHFSGEVISADSRQVYKGLDVGTEKITQTEMRGIHHHLIDVVDIDTIYTAIDFKNDATKAIKEIQSREHLPIIAGGTFFYIDTLLGKVSTAPVAPHYELRAELEKKSTEELFAELREKDAKRAQSVDPKNRRRLIRALEILTSLPEVPGSEVNKENVYEVLTIGLTVDKTVLREKLRERAKEALQKGLIKETETLLQSGISKERLYEIGHEYRLAIDFLEGHINEELLIQKCEEKNWQYAKRQLVWLKRDKDIKWYGPENREAIFQSVHTFLKK